MIERSRTRVCKHRGIGTKFRIGPRLGGIRTSQGQSMSAEDNKNLVLGFFESMNAGNGAAVMNALADSATWWVAGNFPLSGSKTKAQFGEVMGQLAPKIEGALRGHAQGLHCRGRSRRGGGGVLRQDEERQNLPEPVPFPVHRAGRQDPAGEGISRHHARRRRAVQLSALG